MSPSIERLEAIALDRTTHSESETSTLGGELAELLFDRRPVFIQLSGGLGAGKTAFARGFIRRWSMLSGDPVPETVVSPTFNLARVYGTVCPVAHLDLYRVKSRVELEEIGIEQYFSMPACLVEWLEQVEDVDRWRPPQSVRVELRMMDAPESRSAAPSQTAGDSADVALKRTICIRGKLRASP